VALSLAGPHALLTLYALCLSLGVEPGGDDLVSRVEGLEGLRIMAALHKARPAISYDANPIALLEAMASSDGDIALVPLVFGYVNYADSKRARPVRFSEAPRFGKGRRGSVLGGTGIGLSTRKPVSPELADHLRWLMSDPTQTRFIPAHSGQPSARAAWTDDAVNKAWGDFYRNTLETVEHAWVRPRFRDFVPFHNAASARLRAWLRDGSDPVTFLETLRTTWRDARARAGALDESKSQ
jgi:multiple sugar transport system substrate-binding protein